MTLYPEFRSRPLRHQIPLYRHCNGYIAVKVAPHTTFPILSSRMGSPPPAPNLSTPFSPFLLSPSRPPFGPLHPRGKAERIQLNWTACEESSMRFVRTSESSDRCKSVPTGARVWTGLGGGRTPQRRRKKKSLSPFFLFGVAIERAGDQVVNTCSASKYGPPTYLPSTAELQIVWYFLLDCWNLPKSIRSLGSSFQKLVTSALTVYRYSHIY